MPHKPHKSPKQSTGSRKRTSDRHTGRQKQLKEKKREHASWKQK